MADSLAGFPFWKLEFDEEGKIIQPAADKLQDEIASAGLTDLFVFSHGWNNDEPTAMRLYQRFFDQARDVLSDPSISANSASKIGVVGVIWPSILFPGDTVVSSGAGGAADFSAGPQTRGTLASELPKIFSEPEQQQDLQDLLVLIENQPPDNDSLFQFRDKLASLVHSAKKQETVTTDHDPREFHPDTLEFKTVTDNSDDDWMRILDAFSFQPSGDVSEGGAASFGGPFARLWNGAKNVLRVASYWQMKSRAGVVGKVGLGPLLGSLAEADHNLNIHLLGHSFGARLVSYALAGLPASALAKKSPVKSLFLIQGAFSHFAFADALPFDSDRAGDLTGMSSRVDGPLLTTHSLKDLAVGNAYPAASIVIGQDAAAATDLLYRWEGMGHDGAQAVDAVSVPLGDVAIIYPFEAGKWINLDGNQIIVNGGLPSGAHSDIIHPEIAWAALSAAKVAGVKSMQAGGH